MRPICSLSVLALSAVLLSPVALADGEKPSPTRPLILEPCHLPNVAGEARCGTYEVAENRAASEGRKIPLKVVVLPATGEEPAPDPLFYLAGGPGGSAVEEAPFVAYILAEARRQRGMVFVDVRGTGGSKPLYCPYQLTEVAAEEALETFLPGDQMASCRRELEKEADLTQYTTPVMVDDLDEVRAALGYRRINLYGMSGGTRVALVYLRRHPEVVRSAMLEGVVPLESDWFALARDAQEALDGLLAECAAEPACHQAFPDPQADLHAVLERLEKGPVPTPVIDSKTGEEKTLQLSRNVFVQTLRYMLYKPTSAAQVPALLHAAAAGDFSYFGQTAYSLAAGFLTATTDGVYLSVTCSEDVAFTDPEVAAAASAGTFLGDFRLRQQLAACRQWVRGPLPPGYHQPVRSQVPVLILSGERDPVTPVRGGEQVARHLPNSRHVVVPDGGHGVFGLGGEECVYQLQAEFLRRGSVEGLAVEPCLTSLRRPAFLLATTAEEEIALGPEELQRFTGSYQAKEGGVTFTLALVEGRLQGRLGEEVAFLVPVAPLRFKVLGASPGTYVEMDTEGDAVTGLRLVEGGATLLTLERQP